MYPLAISGVGQFHKVTFDKTHCYPCGGGIMLDLVEFGSIVSQTTVPEPETLSLMVAALGLLGGTRRRKRKEPVA